MERTLSSLDATGADRPQASPAAFCEPYAAFNVFVTESIFVFDCSTTPAPLLTGGVWLDPPPRPLPDSAAAAKARSIDELTPDNINKAVLLCEAADHARAAWVQDWLALDGISALVVDREAFRREFHFLFGGQSAAVLVAYPNQILPGLFLGSKASANGKAISDLRITHVLSLLDREMPPPAGVAAHRLCHLADRESEDLTPVMLNVLPFLRDALAAGRRVLVHCDRGASRSASAVLAYLMLAQGVELCDALATVQRQRPCVQPNDGFMQQLLKRAWEAPLLAAWGASSTPPPPPAPVPMLAKQIAPFEFMLGSRKLQGGDGSPPLVTADRKEIQISTSWGSLLKPGCVVNTRALQGIASDYSHRDRLLVVEHLFTPTECKSLLQAADAVGFGRTNYPKAYRGNLRLITLDTSLSEAVWERLRPAVPASIDFDNDTFDAIGLNEVWRLAKYHPGDRFAAHVDACFMRDQDERSLYTVNVYMNEVPPASGGATRFYADKDVDQSRLALADEPVLSVAPEAGLAVVFRQPPGEHLLHDGERLETGLKYLFRTDVMYRRRRM